MNDETLAKVIGWTVLIIVFLILAPFVVALWRWVL